MNTVQRFKSRKIVKAQLGTLLKRGWDWFKNSNQIAAIAESPAVMTASGWRVDKNGKAKQDQQNTKEVKQLRNNLATIGEAGVTAPTLVRDVEGLYNVVRHPVQIGKTIWKAGQDALWFLKNPEAVKVYHGNKRGIKFPLQEARTASVTDIGVHVSPNRNIAETMDYTGNNAIMEAWIPKHNMETLDLGANDYNLLSNDVYFPYIPITKLEKELTKNGNRGIKLRDNTWKMNSKLAEKANKLVEEGKSRDLSKDKDYASKALRVNSETAKFFSDNGKKVIKYNNRIEGGGGTSYIITDPSVFYNPQNYSWNQIFKNGINYTKYPLLYETNK